MRRPLLQPKRPLSSAGLCRDARANTIKHGRLQAQSDRGSAGAVSAGAVMDRDGAAANILRAELPQTRSDLRNSERSSNPCLDTARCLQPVSSSSSDARQLVAMAQRPILWYSCDAVTAAMLLSSLLACNPRLAPAAMLLSLLLWHSARFSGTVVMP